MTPVPLSRARAVFFDLDNTLVDRTAAFAAWLGDRVAPADAAALTSLDDGGHGPREPLFEAVAAALGREVADVRQDFLSGIGPACRVRPDADAVLDHLRGRVPVVIVTNGHPVVQRSKVRGAGLHDRVDHVVVSGDVGAHKPDPAPFLAALRAVGFTPGEVWMVGDHPVNDVEGAARLGLGTVFLRTRHFAEAPLAHLRADDLRALSWP